MTTLTYLYGCVGFQARFNGSQPSMKFVMDTSQFWFRPHINRAEGENLHILLKLLRYFILQNPLRDVGIVLQHSHSNKHTFATVSKHFL